MRFIDQPRVAPGSRRAFLLAALLVALAAALRVALLPWIGDLPYVLFFPTVIAVGFLCGSAAGLAAALLSVVAAWLLILPWDGSELALRQTGFFSVGALTVTAIIAIMRAAGAEVRRSHETLRISEAKFRSLLESAPDAMVIADADRRILLLNAAAERLFGYRRAELSGQPIATLITEAERDLYEAELAAFMIAAPVVPPRRTIDLKGARRNGTEFPLELSFGALKTEMGLLTCNAIRDMTARHRLEE